MLLAIAKSLVGRSDASDADAASKPLAELADEELMLKYAAGEAAAFELLVKRHERALFNFILRSVHRRELAEELLQETFLRIIKSAPRYQKKAKFTTWAYTIARNICIDRARKFSKRKEYSLNRAVGGEGEEGGATFQDNLIDENAAAGSTDVDKRRFIEQLKVALQELPEAQRDVFVMRQFSGLKFREIAEALDIPVPTVKSRMRYALQALRGHMSAYEGHSFDREERKVVGGGD